MTTTRTRQRLEDHVATGATDVLVACLVTLDRTGTTAAHRAAHSAVLDELARRHAAVAVALDLWAANLDSGLSTTDVVLLTVDALNLN